MSFDKFLLAVESRDLSQTDKSIIRVHSFPKLSDGKQNLFFCLSTTDAWNFCKSVEYNDNLCTTEMHFDKILSSEGGIINYNTPVLTRVTN